MTNRVTLVDPVPTASTTPCRDCLAALTCVAEMGGADTPLPVVVQAVAVWPAETGRVSLCAAHHQARATDLERRLTAAGTAVIA